MSNTNYIHQTLLDRLVITKKSLIHFCLSIVFASGLLTALPAMSAPVLEIGQAEFFGVYGVDYPVFNTVADISDGDPETTDYFFEGIMQLYDDSGNQLDSHITSVFDDFILMQPSSFVFPAAGDYILYLDMTTFHQVGGLPGCGPNDLCVDDTVPFNVLGATDSMEVHLSSVPVPAAVWLFCSGLIGLIGVARRKK